MPVPCALAVQVIGIDGPLKTPPVGEVMFTSGWSRSSPVGEVLASAPPRRTGKELVVRPAVPVRRVDDASHIRAADRVGRNAFHLADGPRVAYKRRLEYGSDPRLRLRGREGGQRAAEGPCG